MLANNIMLTISGCDTTRPLDIYFRQFRVLPIMYMTLNTINGVMEPRHRPHNRVSDTIN